MKTPWHPKFANLFSRTHRICRPLLLHRLMFCESQPHPLSHFDITWSTILDAGSFVFVERFGAERGYTRIKASLYQIVVHAEKRTIMKRWVRARVFRRICDVRIWVRSIRKWMMRDNVMMWSYKEESGWIIATTIKGCHTKTKELKVPLSNWRDGNLWQ